MCELEQAILSRPSYASVCAPSDDCSACRAPSSPLRMLPAFANASLANDCSAIGQPEAELVASYAGFCCYLAFVFGSEQGGLNEAAGQECAEVSLAFLGRGENASDTTTRCAQWLRHVQTGYPWSTDFPGETTPPSAVAVRLEFFLRGDHHTYDEFLIPVVDELLQPEWEANGGARAHDLFYTARQPTYDRLRQVPHCLNLLKNTKNKARCLQ